MKLKLVLVLATACGSSSKSISASAGEIGKPARPKKTWLFAGAGVVVAGCAVAMFTIGPWGSNVPASTQPPVALEPQTIRLDQDPATKPRENPTTPVRDDKQARFDAERKPEKIVEALGITPGMRVADIGAGPGFLTVHLARAVRPGGKIVATDIDEATLESLEMRLETAGLGDVVEPRIVEPDSPGLENDAYDAILLAEVDHQLADPVAWLKAAIPALKKTGRIVISNRIQHAAKSATKAGLRLESESTPVPSHFIAVYVATKRSAKLDPPARPDLPPTTSIKPRYSCGPMGKQATGRCACAEGYVSKLDDEASRKYKAGFEAP
jgi:precorrin-6B methylase 2